MNLSDVCKANNVNCLTCIHCFKNYYAEDKYKNYCEINHSVCDDHSFCNNWSNDEKDSLGYGY